MLYLCLSLIALLCVFPHTKSSQYPRFMCFVLGFLCRPKSSISWWMCACVWPWHESFVVPLPDPSHSADDFLTTLWCSKWSCCVARLAGGCPTFKHFHLFSEIGLEVLRHSFPPAQTHIVTHPHTVEQTRTKITHSPSSTHSCSARFALKFG